MAFILCYFNFFLFFAGGKKFSPVTTLFPVFASNSFLAFLATVPPFLLATAFSFNPFAFIVEVAGGRATNGKQRILEIEPTTLHQRVPMFIGSKDMMDELDTYLVD